MAAADFTRCLQGHGPTSVDGFFLEGGKARWMGKTTDALCTSWS